MVWIGLGLSTFFYAVSTQQEQKGVYHASQEGSRLGSKDNPVGIVAGVPCIRYRLIVLFRFWRFFRRNHLGYSCGTRGVSRALIAPLE